MKGSEYVRQIQNVVVENVGWTGGVDVSATWLTQKLGIVAQHMVKLEKFGEDLVRERDEWKALAKQWQEYAEHLEDKHE